MKTLTAGRFNRALAFLKNRHHVVLSQEKVDGETLISVDGFQLQRNDIVRMAEAEGWSEQWKPDASAAH